LRIVLVFLAMFSIAAAASVLPQEGKVSYYDDSLNGRTTASGAKYDKNAMTAAHRTLAFGTRVKVTNLDNGKSVLVTINDRGPHIKGRVIDVSGAAAKRLGLEDAGVARARVEAAP